MNHPLVSLALIVIVGAVLVAYLFGFSAGKDEGHGEGKEEGKKEGAVRAFAVGYDRGKREREDNQEEESDSGGSPGWMGLVLVALATAIVLSLLQFLRQ